MVPLQAHRVSFMRSLRHRSQCRLHHGQGRGSACSQTISMGDRWQIDDSLISSDRLHGMRRFSYGASTARSGGSERGVGAALLTKMGNDRRQADAISHDPTTTPPRLHLHQRRCRPLRSGENRRAARPDVMRQPSWDYDNQTGNATRQITDKTPIFCPEPS
ncbi:hypothetical protein VTN96DRAFT_6501 [Rasamsonia emersonii]